MRATQDAALLDVLVARQPIFDRRGELYAYELLYRGTAADTAALGASSSAMASRVLANAFLHIGLDGLTGGHRAFLNFSRDMLLSGVHQVFDRQRVVIELLETVPPDAEVVAACSALVAEGYTLALDDFEYTAAHEPLLRLARVVKLDVLDVPREALRPRQVRAASHGATVLAERVETREVHEACLAAGYGLFQGYYFSRPELVARKDLATSQLAILQLLNLLRDGDATDGKLEEGFRRDVSLTYTLLRVVNSAAMGGQGIASIRHAVQLVGRTELHKWLTLLLVTTAPGEGGGHSETVRLALQRARMCELAAQAGPGRRHPASHFIVGLFSLLDAILKCPLPEVLARVDLAPDVREALLTRGGPLAPALALVESYERADWASVLRAAESLGVAPSRLGGMYLDALRWAAAHVKGGA